MCFLLLPRAFVPSKVSLLVTPPTPYEPSAACAELYYGGEGVGSEQPQSLTCPYCGRLGFTELTLMEHTTTEHNDTTTEVVSHHLAHRLHHRVYTYRITPEPTTYQYCMQTPQPLFANGIEFENCDYFFHFLYI